MNNLLHKKMTISALSALTFIGMLAMGSANVMADTPVNDNHRNNTVIHYDSDTGLKTYHVNGKTFRFNDLSPEQQAKIRVYEDKMKSIDVKFQQQEKLLNAYAAQMEAKAKEIEKEVLKFQTVSIKFDKDTMNMADMQRVAEQLEQLANVNEQVLQQKEDELQLIENKFDLVDLSALDEIEQHAKNLEQLLIEIAETL